MPIVQSMLAEMVLDVDASALLVYRAAWLRDVKGQSNSREAALAKLHATDSAQQVIDKAVQIFGGLGVTSRRAGREPLPRDPRAAHLRGRIGGAEGGDRPQPSGGVSANEDAAPPGWPRPKGYANGVSASGRLDRHRRRDRLGRGGADRRATICAGQFRQILLNIARHPRRGRRRPRAYRADDLVRHRRRRISARPGRDRRRLARADRQAISRRWRWSASPLWSSRRRGSRSRRWRWCPNDRQLHPRPAAAAGRAAGIPLHLARAPLSRAAQRRGRADRPAGSGRAGGAQRCRRLDLWRDEGPVRADRPAAGRAGRARPRQPRVAARAQQRDAVRRPGWAC